MMQHGAAVDLQQANNLPSGRPGWACAIFPAGQRRPGLLAGFHCQAPAAASAGRSVRRMELHHDSWPPGGLRQAAGGARRCRVKRALKDL